jgi:hypothetical protein
MRPKTVCNKAPGWEQRRLSNSSACRRSRTKERELLDPLPVVRKRGSRSGRGQPGYLDCGPSLLQMVGGMHAGDDPRRARPAYPRAAIADQGGARAGKPVDHADTPWIDDRGRSPRRDPQDRHSLPTPGGDRLPGSCEPMEA